MNKEITAQVVMLPTNSNNSHIGILKRNIDIINPLIYNSVGIFNTFAWSSQHLHFTTDEPIQEGDWYHDNFMRRLEMCDHEDYSNQIKEEEYDFSKIIASTDPTLCLPTIPTTWIKDVYVPSNGSIKKVELKMVEIDESSFTPHCFVLKLTPNNEVVIVDEPHTIYTHPEENADRLDKISKLLDKMNNIIDKKPTSDKELEMAAEQYTAGNSLEYAYMQEIPAFKAGAEWQEKERSLKDFYDHGYIEARVNAEWTDTDMVDFLITYSDRHLNSAKDVLEMYKKLKSK